MRPRLLHVGVLAFGVLAFGLPAPSMAQEGRADVPTPRFHAGGGFWYAEPRGEFSRYIEGGWGVQAFARYPLDDGGVVSLRGDLGFVEYGRETRSVCMAPPVGCRIVLDLTTSNDIFSGGLGPELALPGHAVRPYAYGTLGFAYFSTTSSVGGTGHQEEFARTENFGDGTLAWRTGIGMQIQLTGQRHPVSLDLGADYHANGEVQYLREGDIRDRPDGSLVLDPRRSRADFVTFRLGVSVGIPPRRDRGGGGAPW